MFSTSRIINSSFRLATTTRGNFTNVGRTKFSSRTYSNSSSRFQQSLGSANNWKVVFGLGAAALGTAWYLNQNEENYHIHADAKEPPSEALAQNTVVTGNLVSGGFLVVHLKKDADLKKIAAIAAKIPEIATEVSGGDTIYAGVAFGTEAWEKICKLRNQKLPDNFVHTKNRSGKNGNIPATGGDLLVHVKAQTRSQTFEVIHQFVNSLPEDSIEFADDEYGWHYQEGRDLSGFIDGTENVQDALEKREAGLLPTGGSYVIHQRWVHNIKKLHKLEIQAQEQIIGRSKPDSAELSPLPVASHVARSRDEHGKRIPIIRQSMPFGSLKGPYGLLFIAYTNNPKRFDTLLDRMVGTGGPHADEVMTFSKCETSQYFYVPSIKELADLAK